MTILDFMVLPVTPVCFAQVSVCISKGRDMYALS